MRNRKGETTHTVKYIVGVVLVYKFVFEEISTFCRAIDASVFGLLVLASLDPCLRAFLPVCNVFLRITSGSTPADLFKAMDPLLRTYFFQALVYQAGALTI